jgi:hypothetical protein
MSEELDATLRRMEKAAEVVLHEILNEIEDDSDIYTIKDEGESK